jgi:hypothetical protein
MLFQKETFKNSQERSVKEYWQSLDINMLFSFIIKELPIMPKSIIYLNQTLTEQ